MDMKTIGQLSVWRRTAKPGDQVTYKASGHHLDRNIAIEAWILEAADIKIERISGSTFSLLKRRCPRGGQQHHQPRRHVVATLRKDRVKAPPRYGPSHVAARDTPMRSAFELKYTVTVLFDRQLGLSRVGSGKSLRSKAEKKLAPA